MKSDDKRNTWHINGLQTVIGSEEGRAFKMEAQISVKLQEFC